MAAILLSPRYRAGPEWYAGVSGARQVDFMIIGVQKGGTTALASFLAAHPQLTMAEGKEVHLFDSPDYSPTWTVADIDASYARYFPGLPNDKRGQLCGEATPIYLYWPEIAEQLYRYNPELKLLVLLRDPVERAISHYAMEYRRGNEQRSLAVALLLERFRLNRSSGRGESSFRRIHSYLDRGKYAQQLAVLRRYFSDDQLLILDNSELQGQHGLTLRRVFAFLGVDDSVSIPAEKIFEGGNKPAPVVLKWLLRIYFYRHNCRLKSLLAEMGMKVGGAWI